VAAPDAATDADADDTSADHMDHMDYMAHYAGLRRVAGAGKGARSRAKRTRWVLGEYTAAADDGTTITLQVALQPDRVHLSPPSRPPTAPRALTPTHRPSSGPCDSYQPYEAVVGCPSPLRSHLSHALPSRHSLPPSAAVKAHDSGSPLWHRLRDATAKSSSSLAQRRSTHVAATQPTVRRAAVRRAAVRRAAVRRAAVRAHTASTVMHTHASWRIC
jgi:hypothetical protein